MTCADCKNITRHRQAAQAMYTTKHGFSGCALQPHYVYFSRLREALEWYAEIGTSISPDGLVAIADAGKVARAALTQPTEQP